MAESKTEIQMWLHRITIVVICRYKIKLLQNMLNRGAFFQIKVSMRAKTVQLLRCWTIKLNRFYRFNQTLCKTSCTGSEWHLLITIWFCTDFSVLILGVQHHKIIITPDVLHAQSIYFDFVRVWRRHVISKSHLNFCVQFVVFRTFFLLSFDF